MTCITSNFPAPRPGRISLVGAGPGAAELLTFRAADRLRSADVVFYDRLIDPEVLALIGSGAEKVYVGKEVGAHAWPQARINAVILRAALAGRNVVRLKSGDPSVFGRAGEEIAAARACGIEVEIVPGITAASAAAASLGRSLTERGVTDNLVLATATCQPGEAPSGLADLARPGTTLVLYMAMQRLDAVTAEFLAAGVAPGTEVSVIANASRQTEARVSTTLARMAADCATARLGSPAVVILHLPKTAGNRPDQPAGQPAVSACG